MEVPTISKAYFLGLCKGISPQNMAKHMVLTYLHLLDPEDLPLNIIYQWLTIINHYEPLLTINQPYL